MAGAARDVVNNPLNDWLFDESWGVDVAVSTPSIMTGEWLTVRGRVTQMDGVPTLHNPEFDLVDAPEATL